MSADLRARVLAAAAAEAAPTRVAVQRRNRLLGALGAASGAAAFVTFAMLASEDRWFAVGGDVAPGQHVERSVWLVATTASGALAIAAAASWLALARGRSMLGRPREWLVYALVSIPISLFAWKVGSSLAFGDAMVAWPQRPGLRCLSLSLVVAVGPLLSFLAIRRSAPAGPALNGAVAGLAAGACAWFLVDLWCPVAYLPHLAIGHLLPLLLLAGGGAVLGSRLLSPARRR
ncbi:MAG: NrsF family protein [Candidatus Binatia bacterium]